MPKLALTPHNHKNGHSRRERDLAADLEADERLRDAAGAATFTGCATWSPSLLPRPRSSLPTMRHFLHRNHQHALADPVGDALFSIPAGRRCL